MRVVLLIVLTLIIEVVTFVNEKWFRPFKAWRDKYPEDDRIPLPISIEAYMTTPEMIVNRGYPVEIHHVVTEDGYILELHRIPYSRRTKNRGRPAKKKVVFFQHGLMATDSLFVINPTEKCLDRGYDVWLGNTRGNRYSRNHLTLDPDSNEFWNFSWDEIGYYDVPASMEYVRWITGQQKMTFVGHSLGATIFFIAMIRRPELNARIDRMFALGPTTSRRYSRSFLRHLTPFFPQIQKHLERRTKGSFLKNGLPRHLMDRCEKTYRSAAICRDILISPSGNNPTNFNLTLVPIFTRHFPLGTSVKSIAQFTQNHATGVPSFNAYDHGPWINLRRYGTTSPLAYNLRLVTAPVYIFWSENDLIVTPKDVAWLTANLGNVKGSFRVADPLFNHFDYVLGMNVNQVLNYPILRLMPPP